MSRFMEDAQDAVSKLTSKLENYGFVYAHCRGTGMNPWDASAASRHEEKGVPQQVLQLVRREVDMLIESRMERSA